MEALATVGSSFERQFKNRERLDFPEGGVTVIDMKPEELQDEIPILLVPGWSENYDTYKKTVKVGFNSGRRVLTFGYLRPEGTVSNDEDFPEVELRKAKLLLDVLESKGIDRVDVVAHSEGAINSLIAAMLKPEQFRNIVLDKPAGLIGKDSKVALTGRFIKLMLQEAIARPKLLIDPTSGIRAAGRTARYVVENPQRILDEMDALTNFDITHMMTKLREHGVMFSIISGVDDPLFPVSKQIEHMRETEVPPIEGYYSVIGGHNELSINKHNRHPKAPDYYVKRDEYGEETRVKMDRKFPNSDKMHAALAIDALNSLQKVRSSR